MTTETEKLRNSLRRFAGNPQYRKFIKTMTTTGRGTGKFLYWQEKLWKRFMEEYPEFASLKYKELETAMNLCHLHLVELQHDEVEAHYNRSRLPRDYKKARDLNFPYANKVYFGDVTAKPKLPRRKVLFCGECRKELIRWNARRRDKFGLE